MFFCSKTYHEIHIYGDAQFVLFGSGSPYLLLSESVQPFSPKRQPPSQRAYVCL